MVYNIWVWPPPRIPVANDFRLKMKTNPWMGTGILEGGHIQGIFTYIENP